MAVYAAPATDLYPQYNEWLSAVIEGGDDISPPDVLVYTKELVSPKTNQDPVDAYPF